MTTDDPALPTSVPAPAPFVPGRPRPTFAHRLLGRSGRGSRLVYRVANVAERRAFDRRWGRGRARDGSTAIRRMSGRLRIVNIDEAVLRPDALRRNRDIVVDVCEAHAIEYFAVPEPGSRRFRIGVAGADWARFVDALAAEGARTPLYIGVEAALANGRRRRWAELSTHPLVARAAREQRELEVFRIWANLHVAPFDRPWACVVDRWDSNEQDTWRAPSRNARTTHLGQSAREPATIVQAGRRVKTFQALAERNIFDIDFPIDVVYMWVDGDDPVWRARKEQALSGLGDTGVSTHVVAASDERFRDGGELRYSLRSVEQFAPWVRRIFLVTDGQVPSWLDLNHPKLTVVDHTELFGTEGTLPSFNSHAIGARLHHIPELAEHYLHFNDDVFLGREVSPHTFFHSTGMSRFFLSRSTLGFHDDPEPHEQARRNVVDLLARDFGRSPSRAFFHTPITQRRSTMFELEARYPEEFRRTWHNQFRASTDIEVNQWLHHYYGYLTGKAAPSRVTYDYFGLADRRARRRMSSLLRRRSMSLFCINDSPEVTPEHRAWAGRWLERYFPGPSTFELGDPPGPTVRRAFRRGWPAGSTGRRSSPAPH